jgi:hypothetical protein
MAGLVVIDACSMLNLLATRLELEIVRACDLQLVISAHAHGEALYLHAPPDADGARGKYPASTERLRAAGRLEVRPIGGDSLIDAFVACAALLRDEDASGVALAGVLGAPLVTDDAKERRVARQLFPRMVVVSTLELLHDAVLRLDLTEAALLRVASDLRWRGNFAPPRKDPRAAWYVELLRRAGVTG